MPAIRAAGHTIGINQNKAAPARGTHRDMNAQRLQRLVYDLKNNQLTQAKDTPTTTAGLLIFCFNSKSCLQLRLDTTKYSPASVSRWKWKNVNDGAAGTWPGASAFWALSSCYSLKMKYRIRIRARDNEKRRIYHKVISFIGHAESGSCTRELGPDYRLEHSSTLSLAPS